MKTVIDKNRPTSLIEFMRKRLTSTMSRLEIPAIINLSDLGVLKEGESWPPTKERSN